MSGEPIAFFYVLESCLLSYGPIHFILAWNEHLIPLVVLRELNRRAPLAGQLYGSSLRFPYAALMAGSFVAMIPPMVFFLFSYRRFRDALSNVIPLNLPLAPIGSGFSELVAR